MEQCKSGKSVLIVDDSATMRRMVRTSLRDLPGVEYQEAGNGLEAIERLALGPIDLMIVDLNMPDMHGLEVIRFVRQQPGYKETPIIVLTTRGDEESRTATLAAGANCYLTKPFQPDDMAGRVRELLPLA
ncbi:MAG: response regulator [Planctomycetaceae bacterium]|nr:response regulator [Planctomycetaceae bacterium]